METSPGVFNFDKNTINPLTNLPVASWYQDGETYDSRFGSLSSTIEECRAESVALFLASNVKILNLFNFSTVEDQEKVIYYTFLLMVRAGVKALEWYDPEKNKHAQAHMGARLVITQWLIQHKIASIEEVRSESGELIDAYARVDKEACLKDGKEVIGKLFE